MGGCVFTLHGKNHSVDCVENQWHVSFSARLLQSPEAVHVVHMVALWLNIKSPFSVPDTCSCSHLIPSSPPLLPPPSLSLVSSCAPLLFSLFCWQRLNVTPSAMACCCVCVYKGGMFYQRCSGHGLWLGLAWLHYPLGRRTDFKKKKKEKRWGKKNQYTWAYEFIQVEFSHLNSGWNELHFSLANLMEGSEWGRMDWESGRERSESESWLILSELGASAPSQNMGACLF